MTAALSALEHPQHGLLLRGMANKLEGEFKPYFTRGTIEHLVCGTYDDISGRARVQTHLPAFVERHSRERLRALAKHEGHITDHPPLVLFVCRRNDAASQIAAALFNEAAGDRAIALSAGTEPAGALLDEAAHALYEAGIDLLGEHPKPLTPEVEAAADVIVTVDAHDDIELIEGKDYRAWRLPARTGDGIGAYRAMRDDLRTRVAQLLEDVLA